jgi:putative transposase
VPKRRRQLGPIFPELARQRECQMLEGHLRPDPGHMWIAIPPMASGIGFLKGKRAIAVARLPGKAPSGHPNFTSEHF